MLQQLARTRDSDERDPDERDFGPVAIIRWLWNHKIALFLCSFVAAGASAVQSLQIPRSYHAVALLRLVTPPESQPALNLGGLGGLAGTFLGAGLPTNDSAVTLAYLDSRQFAQSFIEENGLLAEMYPTRWDQTTKQWIGGPPRMDWATDKFLGAVRVAQDAKGLVTLEVIWATPQRAQEIAEQLIAKVNQVRRSEALERAKGNFDYLAARLQKEPVQEMRTTIANLASRQLTLLMMAQGPSPYALEPIGPIYAPEGPVAPQRRVITMMGGIMGFSLCAIILLLRQALRRR